jgi:hypothetical protein
MAISANPFIFLGVLLIFLGAVGFILQERRR